MAQREGTYPRSHSELETDLDGTRSPVSRGLLEMSPYSKEGAPGGVCVRVCVCGISSVVLKYKLHASCEPHLPCQASLPNFWQPALGNVSPPSSWLLLLGWEADWAIDIKSRLQRAGCKRDF